MPCDRACGILKKTEKGQARVLTEALVWFCSSNAGSPLLLAGGLDERC